MKRAETTVKRINDRHEVNQPVIRHSEFFCVHSNVRAFLEQSLYAVDVECGSSDAGQQFVSYGKSVDVTVSDCVAIVSRLFQVQVQVAPTFQERRLMPVLCLFGRELLDGFIKHFDSCIETRDGVVDRVSNAALWSIQQFIKERAKCNFQLAPQPSESGRHLLKRFGLIYGISILLVPVLHFFGTYRHRSVFGVLAFETGNFRMIFWQKLSRFWCRAPVNLGHFAFYITRNVRHQRPKWKCDTTRRYRSACLAAV